MVQLFLVSTLLWYLYCHCIIFFFFFCIFYFIIFFFFSSRRRHTRYIGDWSSDVCSSDLLEPLGGDRLQWRAKLTASIVDQAIDPPISREHRVDRDNDHRFIADVAGLTRSEERRVGKECRFRWATEHYRKKA